MEKPLYVARPAQRTLFLIIVATLAAVWLAGITNSVLVESWIRGAVCLVMLCLPLGLFSISARQFAVYADRIEIAMLLSTWVVPYAKIEETRAFRLRGDGRSRVAPFGGWPFKTTMIVTDARKPGLLGILYRGRGLIVSATKHDTFVAALEDARAKYASGESKQPDQTALRR